MIYLSHLSRVNALLSRFIITVRAFVSYINGTGNRNGNGNGICNGKWQRSIPFFSSILFDSIRFVPHLTQIASTSSCFPPSSSYEINRGTYLPLPLKSVQPDPISRLLLPTSCFICTRANPRHTSPCSRLMHFEISRSRNRSRSRSHEVPVHSSPGRADGESFATLLLSFIFHAGLFQLIRRVGDRVLFLSELRFGGGVAVDGLVRGGRFAGGVVSAAVGRGGCRGAGFFGFFFEAVDFFLGFGDVLR